MSEDDRIARGHRAAHELRVTEEAFASVRQDFIKEMLAATDQAEIVRLHQCVGALDQVRKTLFSAVATGQIAAAAQPN